LNIPYTIYNSDIVVTHKKPLKKINPERNISIYEKHIKKGVKLSVGDMINYARELQVLKKYGKAIELYNKALKVKTLHYKSRVLVLHYLATCYYATGKIEKEFKLTLDSFKYDIPHPAFCCRMGEYFIKNNRFEEAIFWYNLALNLNLEITNFHDIDFYAYRTWLPLKQLAFCFFKIGNYKKSLEYSKKAFEYLPDDEEIINNIKFLEKVVED